MRLNRYRTRKPFRIEISEKARELEHRPCSPQPQIVATAEFFRARYFCCNGSRSRSALSVISIESRTASNRPLSASYKNDDALDCWQPKTGVVLRKVRVQFGDDVIFRAAQACSLHVKTTALRSYAENSRRAEFFLRPAGEKLFSTAAMHSVRLSSSWTSLRLNRSALSRSIWSSDKV